MIRAFRISKKYFLSPKNSGFVNLLSILSIISIAFSALALIVVFSVFNGMGDMIRNVHSSFDPSLKIEPKGRKTFVIDSALLSQIISVDGVEAVTEVIEDDAFLNYRNAQKVVRVKGVSKNFSTQNRIDNFLLAGTSDLVLNQIDYGIIGSGLQMEAMISLKNDIHPIELYYPNRFKKILREDEASFNKIHVMAGGVFQIEKQYDNKYIFVDINLAKRLFGYTNEYTALELRIDESKEDEVRDALLSIFSNPIKILNRDQQHASLYKAVEVEKMITLFIVVALLFVASINIFLTLTMIIVSKRKDIAVMKSFGASRAFIRGVYISLGCRIGLIGTFLGAVFGVALVWLQQNYFILQVDEQGMQNQAFPMRLDPMNIVITMGMTCLVSIIVSISPAISASKTKTSVYL